MSVRRGSSTRVSGLVGALAIGTLALTACGLPADDRVTTYRDEDLPPALANTTTTSTTTTTSLPPPTSQPSNSSDTGTTVTTLPPPETRTTDIFYSVGVSDDSAAFSGPRVKLTGSAGSQSPEMARPNAPTNVSVSTVYSAVWVPGKHRIWSAPMGLAVLIV